MGIRYTNRIGFVGAFPNMQGYKMSILEFIYPRGACSGPDFQIPGSWEHTRAAPQNSNTPHIYLLNVPNKGIAIHRIRRMVKKPS